MKSRRQITVTASRQPSAGTAHAPGTVLAGVMVMALALLTSNASTVRAQEPAPKDTPRQMIEDIFRKPFKPDGPPGKDNYLTQTGPIPDKCEGGKPPDCPEGCQADSENKKCVPATTTPDPK